MKAKQYSADNKILAHIRNFIKSNNEISSLFNPVIQESSGTDFVRYFQFRSSG
jgi:hypothetical protein